MQRGQLLLSIVLAASFYAKAAGEPIWQASDAQSTSCTNREAFCDNECASSLDAKASDEESLESKSTACASLFQGSFVRQRVPFEEADPLDDEDLEDPDMMQWPDEEVDDVLDMDITSEQLVPNGTSLVSADIPDIAALRVLPTMEEFPPAAAATAPSLAESGAASTSKQEAAAEPGGRRKKLVAMLARLQRVRRTIQDFGMATCATFAERMVLGRSGSGSMLIAAGVVMCVGLAFCVASYMHASGMKQDSVELRPVPAGGRATAANSVQPPETRSNAHLAWPQSREATASAQVTTPSPRNMSLASVKPYKRHQSSDTPARFLSTGSAPPTSRSLDEERVDDSDEAHLCPELVVPEGSECTLLVSCLSSLGGSSAMGPMTISDARGVPVFKAVFSAPAARGRKRADTRRVVLSSAAGDAIFAYCRDLEVDPTTGQTGLTIFHHSEVIFGDLRTDGPRPSSGYSVTTRRGWRIRFRGDPEGRNLNCTDEHGRLLAITEAHGPGRRSVRIGPLVDAGFMAICVLGIDILGQAEKGDMPHM